MTTAAAVPHDRSVHPLLKVMDERVFILDGGMGTSLHKYHPTEADWGYTPDGKSLLNLSDALVYTHPEWIQEIHEGYFAAGCDAVETNTFNGNAIGLGEFGMTAQLAEINRLNIQLAKKAAAKFTTPDRPRFVVGSIGPGTKMPSVNDPSIYIDFDTLAEAYRPQVAVMLDEGVDAILIETCFDILQAKIVTIVTIEEMAKRGVKVPLFVQVTIMQADQKMLPGTDIAGALCALECFDEIDVIGLNCAVGPDLMLSSLKHLAQYSRKRISVLPNAGLPETRGEETYFPLQPDELASWLERFVVEFGVNMIGGCCGTTNEHLKVVCDKLHGRAAAKRTPEFLPTVSSLLTTMDLVQDTKPLLVGERLNPTGSRKFKKLLQDENWEGIVDMAREQEREGVHLIDVMLDEVGRDGVRDMREVVKRLNAVLSRPMMFDSTQTDVIEVALKACSGRGIINSISLEDGLKTIEPKALLAKKYGAALVALTIDEKGQADTAEWKFEVAKRIYDTCTKDYKIPPTDLMFDPLVFPVSTGQEQTRKSAIETFNSIKMIKEQLPGALTHVGLSNCSFGLTPYTRQVLNSVYLHYALQYGLDSAILHASKIMPLASIDEEGKEICRKLLFDEREFDAAGNCTYDPLQDLIRHYGDKKTESRKTESLGDTVDERLKQAIIQGRKETLIADLDTARAARPPIEIINNVLLDGMKVVGELFGAGQMQLPFVLQSAEVMKAAVAYLQQYMQKLDVAEKGKIILATVKGDVHDIGKNLVDIILTNNGFTVINIGIKQPVENMITEYQKHNADAIGMSGLLVKSTVIMKDDLITLNQRGLSPPVILGGAALNRRYVEEDLRKIYKGKLFFGEDAFAGLRIMNELVAKKKIAGIGSAAIRGVMSANPQTAASMEDIALPIEGADLSLVPSLTAFDLDLPDRSPTLPRASDIPTPPFLGSRIRTDFSVEKLYQYINERTLFSTQWQFRKGGVDPKVYAKQIDSVARPALTRLKARCLKEQILQPAATYGYFPASSDGQTLTIYAEDHTTQLREFRFPRQEFGDYLCLSDYVEPAVKGRAVDYIAMMAVTMGHEITRACNALKDSQYQDYLFLHGLGVECAEALAESFHQEIRREWGIGGNDATQIEKLFKGHYRGRRFAFGYPACPRLADQTGLFKLIDPTRVGITLTESFLLEPEQSTTAIIFHHPNAKYFNVKRDMEIVDEE